MNPRIHRRRFLGWSGASLAALGIGNMPPLLRRVIAARSRPKQDGVRSKKLFFLFLRGGMDAVQAVIPYGDAGGPGRPTYNAARPVLGAAAADAHDLNGFASLFPAMQGSRPGDPKLADIFHDAVDGRGRNLAILHRIGYPEQNRSHFSSQQFWENGVPGLVSLESGILNRWVTAYPKPESPLQAATLSTGQVVLMKGEAEIPVLRTIRDFGLPDNVRLGVPPSAEDPLGSRLRGAWGQAFDPARPADELTYATGRTLLESLQYFEDNVRHEPYAPHEAAVPYYDAMSDRRFASEVIDCARLLKQVDGVEVVGCNQGNYDTHGAENRDFPILTRDLALAFSALYHDLAGVWDDTLILTLSEFGRSSRENGNRGTDHGEASCLFAMGGPVVGGVYNCDRDTWANGDLFSTSNSRYVSHRTDFRQIWAQVIRDHLGDPDGRLDEFLPSYSSLAAANPDGAFTPLPFLAS